MHKMLVDQTHRCIKVHRMKKMKKPSLLPAPPMVCGTAEAIPPIAAKSVRMNKLSSFRINNIASN
jgi:hypothetical protein